MKIFEEFKEIIDSNAMLHGSYYNGTYTANSDIDIKVKSFKEVKNKIKKQKNFIIQKIIEGKLIKRLLLN